MAMATQVRIPHQTLETKDYIFYDTTLITTNTQDSLFQVPLHGTGNGITGKTFRHTNMKTAGQFPTDIKEFYILGYTAWISPALMKSTSIDADIDFINKLMNGYFEIKLSETIFPPIPINLICQNNIQIYPPNTNVAVYSIEPAIFKDKGFLPFAPDLAIKVEPGTKVRVDVKLESAPGSENPFYLSFGFLGILVRIVL
jgi:hypothetical protein